MAHSFSKIWIHAIWATKDRTPLISGKCERQVHEYQFKQLQELGCPARIINGKPDHVHGLFLLNPQKSLAEIIKQVKGASSHYITQENLTTGKFAWQTGYAAFSVSESVLEKVHGYFQNQKEHHAKKTFAQEYAEFLTLHGLNGNTGNG